MADFCRHRLDVEIECSCGHSAALDAQMVYSRFREKRWRVGLNDGWPFDSPYSHFYCTRCWAKGLGKVRPSHIGPKYR